MLLKTLLAIRVGTLLNWNRRRTCLIRLKCLKRTIYNVIVFSSASQVLSKSARCFCKHCLTARLNSYRLKPQSPECLMFSVYYTLLPLSFKMISNHFSVPGCLPVGLEWKMRALFKLMRRRKRISYNNSWDVPAIKRIPLRTNEWDLRLFSKV